MEEGSTKRRKLAHADGESLMDNSSISALGPSGASAFILETEELLKETKLDYSKAFPGVDDTLRQFKETIESIEPHDPVPIGDASTKFEKKSRVTIPYPDPRPAKDAPYKLSLAKPAQVNVVGSYALQTMIKSQENPSVDMIVVMPGSIFQPKDYLDLRYFYKRAYYLANIACGLREKLGKSATLDFELLSGNPFLPVLVVQTNRLSHAIRVIPTAPENLFPSAKLSTKFNAIRSETDAAPQTTESPSIFYNTTLKAESTYTPYLRLLHKTASSCAAFRDACVLGRIWLGQRGIGGAISQGGFGHFEWAVLVALLLQGGGRKGEAVLSPSLHCTQLFKATLQFLATANLRKKPIVIGENPPDMDKIRQPGPVLYDAARDVNILFKMTPWSVAMLIEQAKWSLAAVNDSPRDQFDPMFIIKADQPLQMFDLLVRIDMSSPSDDTNTTGGRGSVIEFSDRVYQTVKKALGDRARLIHIEVPAASPWPISSAFSEGSSESILVGVSIEPTKASVGREFGPFFEQKKEAEKFRDFWGEKADLWQFPDGNMAESLDWTSSSSSGPTGICEAIIRYILTYRHKIDQGNLEFFGQDFTDQAPIEPLDHKDFDAAKQAFETLQGDIRDLGDLPLQVKQVVAVAPELRRASLHAPNFSPRTHPSSPMDVVVTFELSGRWPENLAAIQRAKIAFLLKIGSSLEESNESVKAFLGLETGVRDVENLAFLDVVYETGACFRIRVPSDLEQTLLERQARDKTLERHVRTEASELVTSFKRFYTNMPLHNASISIFCTRFPALSSSIRLVKQWFSAHKLSCHFVEELIELFVLQAFLKPYPWQTPASATTGFLRTLLLLSRWDWRDEPLVVDLDDSLSASQCMEIDTRLEAWRNIDPNMNRTVMFVATSHDVGGTAYTQDGPSKVVATRMTSLARSACKLAKERREELDPRSLFRTSLVEYDVLIHLSPETLEAVQNKIVGSACPSSLRYKNLADLQSPRSAQPPAVENPMQTLFKQLQAVCGSALLFFHGGPDDLTIAALWNPHLHPRSFTAHFPASFRPSEAKKKDDKEGTELYEVNREAILAEIARLGGDLIEEIEVNDRR